MSTATNIKGLTLRRRRKRERKKTEENSLTIKWHYIMYLSIITLNVNGVNARSKRHRVAEWIRKQDPYICSKTHISDQKIYADKKVKEWKMVFHANGKEKKSWGSILISDNVDFKTKAIVRNKERHYIMIKGAIQLEDITQ